MVRRGVAHTLLVATALVAVALRPTASAQGVTAPVAQAAAAPVARAAEAPALDVASEALVRQMIDTAHPDVRAALSDGGALPARQALGRILAAKRLDPVLVKKVAQNRFAAPEIRDTLVALDAVSDVPGAERVLQRLAIANDDAGARGAGFELVAGAQLRSEVAELSATVDGNEVDAVLKDGTLVEVKSRRDGRGTWLSDGLFDKAVKQLKIRGWRGQKVMLVTNKALRRGHINTLRRTFGARASVLRVTSSGMFRQDEKNGRVVLQRYRSPRTNLAP